MSNDLIGDVAESGDNTEQVVDSGTEVVVEGTEASEEVYTPNYSYKYYGKEEEVPEWARGYFADKETEERFRELFSKSSSFDILRDKYRSREEKLNQTTEKYQELEKTLSEKADVLDRLQYMRDSDLSAFFEYAGIPVDRVIDFVEEYLQFIKAPEAEQKRIQDSRAYAARVYDLHKENETFRRERETQEATAHVETFQEYMEHPEVTAFADKYDELVGKPNAFRDAVIEHGELVFAKSGKNLEPLEAIRAVYRQYKPFVNRAFGGSDSSGGDTKKGAATGEMKTSKKPVVPNVSGGASRGVHKKVFTSIEDLKAHHKAMVANEG